MKYKFLTKDLKNNLFSLSNINDADIQFIRIIRNNQINFLRQKKKITKLEQIKYFKNKVLIETKKKFPEMILFGLFEKKKIIGYGGLVHISWKDKRAELSLLLDDRINSKNLYQLYSIFIDLSLHLAFKVFKFSKITTETYSNRRKIISTLKSKKFILEGKLKKHVIIDGKYLNSYLYAKFK